MLKYKPCVECATGCYPHFGKQIQSSLTILIRWASV